MTKIIFDWEATAYYRATTANISFLKTSCKNLSLHQIKSSTTSSNSPYFSFIFWLSITISNGLTAKRLYQPAKQK